MQIHIIINQRAGTIVGGDVEVVADDVSQRLAAAGHEVSCQLVDPCLLAEALRAARKMQPDVLIVGGGDGTVRCAAALTVGTETTLGILPLGTINRLARDLEVPLDHGQAADALAKGRIKLIDVAEVNGRLFLCNAILGPTTRFSVQRQKLRGKPTVERLTGYYRVILEILRGSRRMVLTIDDGTGAIKLKVLSLVVTNNPFSDESSLTLRRPDLATGALATYASRHSSGWAMAAGAIRALLGRLNADPNVVQMQSERLRVSVAERGKVALSIDGEVEEVATPLEFVIRPKSLRVLVPGGNV